jgi:NAD(P)-dependent dehydrogenase (short-subunit alcohol dehydrogenase family)
MQFDFSGRMVLVTGGTSGIGLAIAQGFRRAGATVIVAGLPTPNTSELEGLEVSDLDVTDNTSVESLLGYLDRIDVLVNAAGMIRRGQEHNIDVFQQVLDVNLNGTMRVSMAAYEKLSSVGGCMVNVASMLSFFGGGLVPAYSASKGGIAQLTKSLAIAWAPKGIRVNAVAPGWIITPLTQALQDDPARAATVLARTPMARWGKPEDIVGPTLFLCSNAANFITGVILPVDGGYLIS